MPTYTDKATGKRITSAEPLTPDELEEAFGLAGETKQSSPIPVQQEQSVNPFYHGALATASGINKGISGMFGMPVDVANKALSIFGLGTDKPFLGSKYISEELMPTPIQPKNKMETVTSAVGEQLPYFLPGIGVASRTGQLANALWQSGKVALGSGVGSGVARIIDPNNPYLDMAAQLTGGLTPTAIKTAIKTLPASFETNMMERALKPSTVLKETERTRRLSTALDEGIPTTKGGLKQTQNTINEINQEIQQKINNYAEQGLEIDRNAVIANAEKMRAEKVTGQLAFPDKPNAQIDSVIEEFMQHPEQIGIRQAQNFKQSINKELDDFYKALNTSPDKTTALSMQWTNKTKAALADGIRKEIDNIFPEISGLNQREASLIQLKKSLEQAVNRISQHDIWSLRGVISLVGSPKMAFTNYILNNPTVQSNLAIAIRRARTSPINSYGLAGEAMKQAEERLREQ